MIKNMRVLPTTLLLTGALFLVLFTAVTFASNDSAKAIEAELKGEPECLHDIDSTSTDTTVTAASSEISEQEKIIGERPTPPGVMDFLTETKYLAFGVLMVIGLILLFGGWVNRWIRIGMLLVAFVLFGLDYLFPLHPSPMCAITKLFMFKITLGQFFPAFLAVFLAMFVPSLFGRKLFCGWVCPLGALQSLINKIPFKPRFKNFNFTAFNAVRMMLLVMFILTFFWVKDQFMYLGDELGADTTERAWSIFSAYNIYDPINFFHILHWHVDTLFIIGIILLVGGSLMLYRPFCYLICPIGALTWLLEKIAPARIRIDFNACTQCGECYDASPCPTIKPMVEQSMKVLPDCTSCGECIASCPENAIQFRLIDKQSPE